MTTREPTKVAIVCGAGIVSGKEIMSLELGRGLRDGGFAVEFVTSKWGNGDFAGRTMALGFETWRMWLGFISAKLKVDTLLMTGDQLRRWPALMLKYRQFLRRVKPRKIIHTNWHHLLLLMPYLKPERDMFWVHEVFPKTPQHRRMTQQLSRRLGTFIAVSHAVRRRLEELGIATEKIRVIHNGISDDFLSSHKTESTQVKIGIVGQIAEWKGHQDCIEALSLLQNSCAEAELHVYGGGVPEFENRLRLYAENLGIANRVIWHGFVGDRSSIYKEIDICAVPSLSEDPLPTVAIEAAFAGIPVVASSCGGLPEIIKDGETGFLVEKSHPEQFAKKIGELAESPSLRSRMGALAQEHASNKFSKKRFIQEFTNLITSS